MSTINSRFDNQHAYSVSDGWDTVDKEMVHILGETSRDGTRWREISSYYQEQHVIENLQIFFFFYGIFHLVFSGHSWLWVTKVVEGQMTIIQDHVTQEPQGPWANCNHRATVTWRTPKQSCFQLPAAYPIDGKESASNTADSFPGAGRSFGEGNGNPLQYSCLGNPMDGEAWWGMQVHGDAKSQTQLSN